MGPPQTGLQGLPARGPGASRRGVRGPRRLRARGLQGLHCLKALTRRFAAARGQDPSTLSVGFRVFPSRGKSMYIVYIWPTGVAGGRAVPPDVREEFGGALYVHSP